jgi:GT2 family glycosyltransferase
VLIDDGSNDGTDEMVRERIENLTVIRGNGDWWWAGCLQQGFNFLKKKGLCHDDYVLITNDDVVFNKDFLAKGIAILEKEKQALLLAQFQDEDNSPPQETGLHFDLKKLTFSPPSSSSDINCLSTRGLFLKWGDFENIGGFHPTLLPHYSSDYEFTIRAHKKGYRCLTSPELILTPKLRETGRLPIDNSAYFRFWKSLFSIKQVYNPIYQISFVILVCPVRWIPRNLLRIMNMVLLINYRYLNRKLKEKFASLTIKQNIEK